MSVKIPPPATGTAAVRPGSVPATMDDMIAHVDRMSQMVGSTPDLDTLRGMMTKQMDLVQSMQKAMYEMIATAAFENAKKNRNDAK